MGEAAEHDAQHEQTLGQQEHDFNIVFYFFNAPP